MTVQRGPLTFGQLSLWRSVMDVPRSRRHEANVGTVVDLPAGTWIAPVRSALAELECHHPSLRTTYDVSDAAAPVQIVHPAGSVDVPVVDGDEADAHRVAGSMRRVPVDLGRDRSWRFTLVRDRDASRLVCVHHHIGADGIGKNLLIDHLLACLGGGDAAASVGAVQPYDLVDLAHSQRSDANRARAAAGVAYWRRALDGSRLSGVADAQVHGSTGRGEVTQLSLRSRASRSAAHDLGACTRTSVSTVVLAAYLRAVHVVQRMDPGLVLVLSSNRFSRAWQACVTTLNQWTPVPTRTDATDLASLSLTMHQRSLQAYRHGMYDPMAVAELRAGYPAAVAATESQHAVNHIVDPSAPSQLPAGEPDGAITVESAFQRLGPRFYLRITDDGRESWTLRLRTAGVEIDSARALLGRVHQELLDAVAAGPRRPVEPRRHEASTEVTA